MSAVEPIRICAKRVEPQVLAGYLGRPYRDLIKFVVDVDRGLIAVGGDMHVDAEEVLLENGSSQESLRGGNYRPGRGPTECIEYNSMINIRPNQNNRSLDVQDESRRSRMRELVFRLLGRGEPVP